MKRLSFGIAGAVAALAVVSVAQGQTPPVSATIPLKYLEARAVPATVKTVEGIDQVTIHNRDNSITVRGSQAAVAAYRAEVEKTDVPPIMHIVKMRLVRYDVDTHGKVSERVEQAPIVSGMDGKPATLSTFRDLSGFILTVTPTQNTDKTVTLAVEVREQGDAGEIVQSGKSTRIVKVGEAVRVTGMTTATAPALRRAAQRGEIVTNSGVAYSGYYVEVQAAAQPSGSAPSNP